MVNCLALPCIGASAGSTIKQLIDTSVLAPWVVCSIVGVDGIEVTVGNRSNPPNNRAVIKSFQFGLSNGMGCNVEIFDEEGGNFSKFFDKITIGGTDSINKYKLNVRWGWQTKNCNNEVAGYAPPGGTCCPTGNQQALASCSHTLVIRDITVHYVNGGFKFLLEGTDVIQDLFEGRAVTTVGTAKNPTRLVPSVTSFLKKYGIDVAFVTISGQCNPQPMMFTVDTAGNGNATEGPACDGTSWQTNGRNPVEAAISWVFTCLTAKQKGIWVLYASSNSLTGTVGPTLVFMEANSLPDCNTVFDSKQWNLGTYIVNGGNCSSVLSFTPNIKWSAAMAYNIGGGQTGGAGGGAVLPNQGPLPCFKVKEYEFSGMEQIATTDTLAIYHYGLEHQTKTQERLRIHQHANLNWSPITAELRVQGDPAYNDPVLLRGRYISVVVMNPFYIGGNAGTLEWQQLAGAPCNQVLTNKNWMLTGVMHDIREGSYTTTLKLNLPAPGITIPVDASLGGDATNPTTVNS